MTPQTSDPGDQDDAKMPISQSAAPSSTQPPPRPALQAAKVGDEIYISADDIPGILGEWEKKITQKTQELLLANEAQRTGDLDGIFGHHTTYSQYCQKYRFNERARKLWLEKIMPLVDESEARLKAADPKAHIHCGAPLFNVGVSSFILGDFDRAMQFIAEAGRHDEMLGRGNPINILIGDHPLSQQVFIEPLTELLKSAWGADYAKITGKKLDVQELKWLLRAMSGRPSDAIQAVVALHRFRRSLYGHQNHGTALIRFRALADLLHLLESFLKQFQTGFPGQLKAHLDHLVKVNPTAKGARDAFNTDQNNWAANNGVGTQSPQAMNWVSGETRARVASAPTHATATGVAVFFCHQFRNSLLHVNEENLTIFQNREECIKAVGWVLGVLRTCARAKEGKFSLADFP